jgi:hypothetical protein
MEQAPLPRVANTPRFGRPAARPDRGRRGRDRRAADRGIGCVPAQETVPAPYARRAMPPYAGRSADSPPAKASGLDAAGRGVKTGSWPTPAESRSDGGLLLMLPFNSNLLGVRPSDRLLTDKNAGGVGSASATGRRPEECLRESHVNHGSSAWGDNPCPPITITSASHPLPPNQECRGRHRPSDWISPSGGARCFAPPEGLIRRERR